MSALKLIFGLLLLLSCSGAIAEEPLVCPNANATVSGMDKTDFIMICEAVTDTAKLMSSLGFNTSGRHVWLTKTLRKENGRDPQEVRERKTPRKPSRRAAPDAPPAI